MWHDHGVMLAIVFALLFLSPVQGLSCPYECEVINWLNSQDISWRQVSFSPPRRHYEETHHVAAKNFTRADNAC